MVKVLRSWRLSGTSSAIMLGAVFCCSPVGILCAQAELKVAVVDVQRVISESAAGKAAKKKLEQLVQREEKKLKTMQEDFKELKTATDKQKSLLSGGAMSDRQEELTKKERELARAIEDKREEIFATNQTEIGRLVKEIDKVVDRYGREHNLTIVLESDPRLVVYAAEHLDVTNEIIEALD